MRKSAVRLTAVVAVALFLLLLAGGSRPAAASPAHGDLVRDQWIVTLKPDANPGLAARASGGEVLYVYEHAIKGFTVRLPEQAAMALLNNPSVLSVQPDTVVQLTSFEQPEAGQRMSFQSGQTIPTGILRIDGDLSSTVSGNGSGTVNVGVAVIDTGITSSHADLNVVGGKNCSTGRSYADGHGHGTHVAGTIAARDNSIGVVGVAPGAPLYAVRVLNNQGSGTTSSIICGVDYVTANAHVIKVANMSLGGSGSDSNCGGSDAYHNAICASVAAGVTYVVAAGNENTNANNVRPATYNEVITVSALADFNGEPGGGAASTCRADVDDSRADFSNYGADVDITAPGVCIYSTWKDGGYNTISGTSMASPHVAGAAALVIASNPGASPATVKTTLQGSGNLNWNNSDDPDGIKEVLLNVAAH